MLRSGGFEGSAWDHEAQVRFSRFLADADFFEGTVSARDPDFSARDRINRAPRTFGFVRLPSRGPLMITPSGSALIEGDAFDDLFLHQVLKWQYPSPNHRDRDYRELFRIRPFLEILRLITDLQGLAKAELALFAVTLIDYRHYEVARERIVAFRRDYSAQHGTRARREFLARRAAELFREYYADDISAGFIGGRERRGAQPTVADMIRRKVGNARDYADAAVRYFRATGLFTVSARASRLDLLPERRSEVEEILANLPREPLVFADESDFYQWLGDPAQPHIPSDQPGTLRDQIQLLYDAQRADVRRAFAADLAPRIAGHSAVELKRDYRELVELATAARLQQEHQRLAGQEVRLDEIIDLFDRIREMDAEIVDRPLYFEWNVWRAFVVLDDGEIRNNFGVDQYGEPTNPAPGRVPDIECDYPCECHLLVEVTLTVGATQHAAEREPVSRHVGLHQARAVERGDTRPVYGLFIAPTINATVLTDFWNLHNARRPAAEFRGHVRVIPMPLQTFILMLNNARGRFPVTANDIARFCEEASHLARDTPDEVEWGRQLETLAGRWLGERPQVA